MQNQPAPLPTPPLPKSPLQGCGKGCTTALVIFVILLVIFWVIGNNKMQRDEYRRQPPSAGGGDYRRTEPGYDANAPLLPRDKEDVEPLYNEVQRRKKEQGISDEEAVRQIIEEQERAKRKQ
jgi:hypothetical protein